METPNRLFYRKELVSTAFFVGGAAAPFEILEGNRGVLALDPAKDAAMIAGLDEAAAKRRGGVIKISEADYEDLKKNHPFNPFASRLRKDVLQVMPSAPRPKAFNPVAAAVAAAEQVPAPVLPAAPASTPAPDAALDPSKPLAQGGKPATRRIGKAASAVAATPPDIAI